MADTSYWYKRIPKGKIKRIHSDRIGILSGYVMFSGVFLIGTYYVSYFIFFEVMMFF